MQSPRRCLAREGAFERHVAFISLAPHSAACHLPHLYGFGVVPPCLRSRAAVWLIPLGVGGCSHGDSTLISCFGWSEGRAAVPQHIPCVCGSGHESVTSLLVSPHTQCPASQCGRGSRALNCCSMLIHVLIGVWACTAVSCQLYFLP